MASARHLFLATRPKFLTASILPVLLGTAYGANLSGHLDGISCALAVAATASVHGAANVLNDVTDSLSGNDAANTDYISPYTGGSRFIQDGILSVAAMTRLGWALALAAVCFGLALSLRVGPGVLVFGASGVLLGILYSMPPFSFSARGLGEAAVAIAFGPLPVIGAAWVQASTVDASMVVLSLPVAFWIVNVLLVNEVPDRRADSAVGRRTLAVRLGVDGVILLYIGLMAAALLVTVLAVLKGLFPMAMVVGPLLLLVLTFPKIRALRGGPSKEALVRCIRLTLAAHMVGTFWLLAVVF